MRFRLLSSLLPLLPAAVAAQPAGAEPNPFRLDAALEGRGFEYNDESFLHRFSYRLAFPLIGDALWREGFFGAAGSVRAREFFIEAQARKTVPLEDWGRFEFRFTRGEDFDGRYDRMLVGMGWRASPEWTASLLGDLPGDKSLIDARAELAWQRDGGRFRLALIATDFQYNARQSAAHYDRLPFTLFAERRWRASRSDFYAHANMNFTARWRRLDGTLALADRQQAAGLAFRSTLGARRGLRGAIEGLAADRTLTERGVATGLARNHLVATLQIDFPRGAREAWTGLRFFGLDETRRANAAPASILRRREMMLYGGAVFRSGARMTLRPELLVNWIDNRDDRAPPPTRRSGGLFAKLGLPLDILLDRGRDARLVVNPTLKLHDLKFGGGQVQLRVPF